ncbi:MSCRAMM family protein [Eubacterium ventriosum]|mgnify:CR=1 FL=1|uniref:MSCRAMM family protein n=1 Tax=Eubacterium ventriosum TaxID=39496 RepID=UPI002108EBE4|nr:SpaA isopeptide-forming pilin-related protein [Eubacterium ventriosum]
MKSKKLVNKLLSVLMAVIMTIGLIPMGSVIVKADTKNATLSNLGELGTVKIGNKSESGTWYQTEIAGTPVFCMDLGKACHAGDVYVSSDDTYSSNSSNAKKANEAKIGYWYSVTKEKSTKAWVYAQALMWSCEEGNTSKNNLTDVISQVRKNTGYYNSKSAADLYDEIFGITTTVICNVKIWKYGGSGEYRQVLMEIKGGPVEYDFERINDTLVYRQRITIDKTDEDGNPVARVPFEVTAQNYKELYDYKVNGWGNAETGDADGDSVFSSVAETDSKGRITYKFNYQIQSKNYGYVKASDLKNMTADDKKAVKEKMDDKNITYASNLTQTGAKELMQADLDAQMKKISNQYAVKEVGAGSDDMLVNSDYANGKIITIESAGSWTKVNGSWPETADKTYANYSKATKLGIVNKYKKATIVVNKKVENTSDNTAHGDVSVDGAVYRMYQDAACTKPVTTVYDANGNAKGATDYTINNGTFETDYIRTKDTVYLKEIQAPVGFFLDPTVHQIKVEGSQFDVEYKAKAVIEDSYESEKKGFFEVYKMSSDGSTGPADFEEGAEFQIYLRSNGSYDKCKDDEHSTLTIDKKGSAKTASALAYGTYVLHQTKTGAKDTEKIDDQIIEIGKDITSEGLNYKTYTYLYNNKPFEAYLKVVKKDGDTDKTVLKANTKYQIYKVNKDGSETKVVQQYSNGNKLVDIDTFVTDESGEIMTVKALKSGTYRIYETDSASGLVIKDKYIDVTIGSQNPDYTSWTDTEGNSHALVTVHYVNKEAKGKLTLTKTGEVLKSFNKDVSNPEKNKFNYKDEYLKGQTFNIYAADTIVTQDNQGTNWFDKGELVATVTTGKGADFTKQCSDITTATVDDETGAVTVYLPLGKYTVKEETTLYGFVIPEKNSWDIEFKWNDAKTDVVSNSTKDTDKEGNLNIKNERAKADVEINKKDMTADLGVADTVFNFYTKNDIYNADGELLLKADELVTTVKTDKNGKAAINTDLPIMSEGYNKAEDKTGLNSGDYYFVEDKISNSYYIDKTPVDIHLEYKDAKTAKIKAEAKKLNKATEVNLSKVKLTDSTELAGASLKVIDDKGNEIISWVSGNADSIKITDKADELGYRNLRATMVNGNLVINGLLQNAVYEMTETRPADGFATAESIRFKLTEGNANGEVTTIATVIGNDGSESVQPENKVVMKDDTIKVNFSKTKITGSKELPGCKLEITDENGNVIEKWTSGKKPYIVEGKLVAGKTYKFTETRPADGYATAESIKFTVSDTGEVQKVRMKDDTIKVEILKTDKKNNKKLPDAEFTFKLDGKKVVTVKTDKNGVAKIDGKLIAGKTYDVEETKAPEGYKTVPAFKYKVKDTGKVQTIKVSDERSGDATPATPNWRDSGAKSPQTGDFSNPLFWITLFLLSFVGIVISRYKIRKKDEEAN